ncbi:MAG TPA: 2-oxoglutarate dehydrogenase complex dihydrolipoyllysine-residue succinyltransferase [Tepidisphaeraceae bacterium]|nr:2-oxoglutarate dehydrogenase complex dihydrolipoyllysine-residue succinyltransferase [Tepidisphaeraceae bacterium]
MATQVEVPPLGESIKEAVLAKWYKSDGDRVTTDEPVCELETDKTNVDLRASTGGIFHPLKSEGAAVSVGEVIGRIDENAGQSAASGTAAKSPAAAAAPVAAPKPKSADGLSDLSPAVRSLVAENKLDPKSIPATGNGGRLTREDVEKFLTKRESPAAPPAPIAPAPVPSAPSAQPKRPVPTPSPMKFDASGVYREPMSKMRKRIAQNLVEAQHNTATLTTSNEIDLTAVTDLRTRYKERFQEVHGIGLGFMSFFVKAAAMALREFPRVNAFIEGDELLFHNYVHMGIAVSTDRGLAVPVLRDVQDMSLAKIEGEIKRLATATRDGKLALHELAGGTFTITNGGVFGSLFSTPILNPPQSGILGMHAIQKRPVVVNDKIEIRPMMYVALSYDHRVVDGRESVSFLVRVKQLVEDPARLMLEI